MAKKSNKQPISTGSAPVRKPAPAQQNTPKQPKATDSTNFWDRYGKWAIPLVIGILTYAFLQECTNNELTNWDDLGYIITNQLIKDQSPDAIKNIFSTANPVMGNYHPLTILLYYFEYQKYGLDPWIYHFDSVLLHVLCTIAVYYFIRLLTGNTIIATIAGLLFGLHPMHVESVAWAAGRKDILYGVFFVLSMSCYIKYLRADKKAMWYVLGLLAFATSLLAKSVAVTLPITLFAIDCLEKRPFSFKEFFSAKLFNSSQKILLEKIPHFLLSLLFGLLSVAAQKDVGAYGSLDTHFNPLERFSLGMYALTSYLWKAIVPAGLSNFYPYPLKEHDALPGLYYIYPILMIGLAFVVWKFARKNRAVIFGLGFFLINIVLLLQFIPVGGAIMSDRYGYIPYIGLFFIIGWFVARYYEKAKEGTGKILFGVTIAYCLVLGFASKERCKDWYDSLTLWQDDIDKHPEAPVGYFYMGQAYFTKYEETAQPTKKKLYADSALFLFNMSVARKPDYINPIICIAELQRNFGMVDSAKSTYMRALKIKQDNESVYMGLGVIYSIQAQNATTIEVQKQLYDSAQFCFRRGLQIKPFSPEGHSNFANYFDIVGKLDSSLKEYAISIEQDPDAYIPYMNRGRIYQRLNKFDEAIKDFNKAVEKKPESGDVWVARAKCYLAMGNKQMALQDMKKAESLGLKLDPSVMSQLQ
ncbi:MAG: hypothetical protein K0Q79_1829 [Flavipsychrobacter sp.]|jgi:tetratricopeptide (TPR) repeat protein|nr:hypothetical protein [Flavipsychrobacter sp.]